jgi:hypothetical protein
VELKTRFFCLVITIVFAVFFAYSYPQDVADGAVWSLAIDGILLAIALFSLVDFVRCCMRIHNAKKEALAPLDPEDASASVSSIGKQVS